MTATEENTTTTFFLADYAQDKFDSRMGFLNKKCKRFGLPPVSVTLGDLRTETYKFFDENTNKNREVTVTGRDVTVDNRSLAVKGGWFPVAKMEDAGDGKHNIVSGDVEDLERLKTLDLKTCDHCGCKHNRKKAYIISDGEVEKVVGSTCLRDHLGISANAFLSLLDAWRDVVGMSNPVLDEDEYFGMCGDRPRFHDIENFISKLVKSLIFTDFKYVSATQAREDWTGGTRSTVDFTSELFNDRRMDYKSDMKVLDAKIEKSGIDIEEVVEKILNMLKETYTEDRILTEENAFDYNLCVAVVNGFYPDKSSRMIEGSLAYKVFRFLTTDNEKTAHPAKEDSEHFGNVKDKIEADVVVTFTKSFSSEWGESLMVVGYVAGTSNYFMTYLSGDASFVTSAEGGKLRIRATIKSHRPDNGYGKSTQLTRTKLAAGKTPKGYIVLN